MILKQLKYLIFFLLTFLLGAQFNYAKTELVLPQKSVSFSIEQTQSFKSLEKDLQPNIGFLFRKCSEEKTKFEGSEGFSVWKLNKYLERDAHLLGKGVAKFTTKQIDDYVLFATKQSDQSKVMLGLYDNGGVSSYISKAGNNHTYFDMGTVKWTEAENIVGGSLDEMWKINKKFIDDQKALGKEFWFSHDPFTPVNDQFYAREINYLIDQGVTDFIKIGDSWKAIW